MGNYLTQTGGTIAAATGDLTDQVGNDLLAMLCPDGSGGISTAKVTACITKAEARIDVMLSPIYTVPLTPVPNAIKTIAADLFVYYAYDNRPEFATRDGKNPAAARFADAKEMLVAFKDGKPVMPEPATREEQYVGVLVESDTARGWDDVYTDDDTDDGSAY